MCLVAVLLSAVAADAAAPREVRRGSGVYVGEMSESGKYHGYGVCRYDNGNVYYGYWKNDFKEGLGRMVYADGTIEFGTWSRGRYVKPAGMKFRAGSRVYGIDVSKYQKTIRWTQLSLSADARGVVSAGKKKSRYVQPVLFALMKSTEGVTVRDPQFDRNFREARRCGVVRGAYHFLSTTSDVDEQVRFFIANTPLEPGDFPPVLDLEVPEKAIREHTEKVIAMALRWLVLVEKHYGVKPVIYTYERYYKEYLRGTALEGYDYWIARYGKKPDARHWEVWQFTEKGVCKGIDHRVDIDLFRGDYKELRDYIARKGIKAKSKAKSKSK